MKPFAVSGQPTLTVAICTYGFRPCLLRCLESIVEASDLVDETIISVDRASTYARVADDARGFEGRLPALRVLKGPDRGLASNRNACVDATTSEYVLFLDDDARVTRTFLRIARRHLSPTVIVTGFEWRDGERVEPQDADFLGFLQKPVEIDSLSALVINSTVFPVRILRELSFDEFYRFGSEEAELALAAVRAGVSIIRVNAGNFHDRSEMRPQDQTIHALRSRGHFGMRRYLVYERRPLSAMAFLGYGLANAAYAGVRQGGVRSGLRSAGVFARGAAEALKRSPRRHAVPHSGWSPADGA
jgi:glycosyltransferase involved in cell wall biosynthesis